MFLTNYAFIPLAIININVYLVRDKINEKILKNVINKPKRKIELNIIDIICICFIIAGFFGNVLIGTYFDREELNSILGYGGFILMLVGLYVLLWRMVVLKGYWEMVYLGFMDAGILCALLLTYIVLYFYSEKMGGDNKILYIYISMGIIFGIGIFISESIYWGYRLIKVLKLSTDLGKINNKLSLLGISISGILPAMISIIFYASINMDKTIEQIENMLTRFFSFF